MIKTMPRWIWIGGLFLSFIAGYINVSGLLLFQHQAVSHVTGSLSQLGISFSNYDFNSSSHIIGVIFSFLLGAILSSFIIRDSILRFGKRYGLVLFIESVLIGLGMIGFAQHIESADFFISAACGVQNAMVSTYSGAVLRTTHMTGVVTDLGIWIGQFLSKSKVSFLNLRLYLSLLSGFTLGSIMGAILFSRMNYMALSIPAISIGIVGVCYIFIRLKLENAHKISV